MTAIGIILIIIGVIGLAASGVAFGDIGVACALAGLTALFSGIGFLVTKEETLISIYGGIGGAIFYQTGAFLPQESVLYWQYQQNIWGKAVETR